MAMPHEDIKGKFMIVARIVAIEGKEEELKALLAAVREHSTTKESLCLTYRTMRGAGPEHGVFTVVEEYTERAAIEEHRGSEPYKALRASGLIKEFAVSFNEEFQ